LLARYPPAQQLQRHRARRRSSVSERPRVDCGGDPDDPLNLWWAAQQSQPLTVGIGAGVGGDDLGALIGALIGAFRRALAWSASCRAVQLLGHRVRRMPIEVVARSIARTGRTGVGVPDRVLRVLQRDAVREQLGGEAVAQAVRG